MATMLDSASTVLRDARLEIEEFNYGYAETLDAMDVDGWVEYFTEDAFYHVIARDNAGSGLPLGLIYCEGKAMMKDRAYALLNTEMFAPRFCTYRSQTPARAGAQRRRNPGIGQLHTDRNAGRGNKPNTAGRQVPRRFRPRRRQTFVERTHLYLRQCHDRQLSGISRVGWRGLAPALSRSRPLDRIRPRVAGSGRGLEPKQKRERLQWL